MHLGALIGPLVRALGDYVQHSHVVTDLGQQIMHNGAHIIYIDGKSQFLVHGQGITNLPYMFHLHEEFTTRIKELLEIEDDLRSIFNQIVEGDERVTIRTGTGNLLKDHINQFRAAFQQEKTRQVFAYTMSEIIDNACGRSLPPGFR